MDEKTFWRGKKVLVTGGAGFIGGNLLKKLWELDANVSSIDLDAESLLGNYSFIYDLVDIDDLSQCLDFIQPEIIFHLAAQPIVPKAKKQPLETMEDNLRGTYNLLCSLIGKKWLKSLVVASTDKVYGENLYASESDRYDVRGIYEVSKVCVDLLSKSFSREYEIPIAITRCGNVYGKGDKHTSRLIPGMMKSAFTGETFQIRSDGQGIREYVYVDDVVDAYLLIAINSYDGVIKPGEAINISSSESEKTLDLVDKVYDCLRENYGIILKSEILNQSKEIVAQGFGGSRLDDFGWTPQWTIEKGIAETIKWYKEYYERTKSIR